MQFAAPAEHYDRFMGRYTPSLAAALADAASVNNGERVLDVGCGPGGLTRELAARVGAANVAAIDPALQMLRIFWSAVREVNPAAEGERRMAGTVEGDIAARFERAGLANVTDGALTARADYAGFDDFWEPFTFAVGPSGQHVRSLSADQQARVREACRAALPDGPFTLDARAWCARGTVPTR
jgi:SAM-dependent methyltransferase